MRRVPALIPVYDPEAVGRCAGAGEGATLSVSLGGRYTPGMAPVSATGRVVRIVGGDFTFEGPFMAGVAWSIGRSALLRAGKTDIVVTSKAPFLMDRAGFAMLGVEPRHYAFVVVKSAMHFQVNATGVGEAIAVRTDGLTSFAFDKLPYRQARPIFPVDQSIAFKPSARRYDSVAFR